MTARSLARRHVSIHLQGEAAEEINALRLHWDPVMARVAAPHVTVVYPEETVDERVLLDRLAAAAAEIAPFSLRFGEFACEGEGHGGVFALVNAPTGRLEALRDRLLLPPQRFSGNPFHVTIAHPRTARSPAQCWQALRGHHLDVDILTTEALWTATDGTSRRVLDRFPFVGGRQPSNVTMAGAMVLDGDRVLLGLRRHDRGEHPGVWDIPGGHVEADESPRQALQRELREELGIDAVLEAPWRRIVDDGLRIDLTIWVVRQWNGAITNKAALDEHETLAWFTPSDLAVLPFPHPSYPALLADALST